MLVDETDDGPQENGKGFATACGGIYQTTVAQLYLLPGLLLKEKGAAVIALQPSLDDMEGGIIDNGELIMDSFASNELLKAAFGLFCFLSVKWIVSLHCQLSIIHYQFYKVFKYSTTAFLSCSDNLSPK